MPADTMILYGSSGSTKTSQCMFLAKWMYEKFGLLTRWVSSDGGGWKPCEDEGLIEAGIVTALDVTGRRHILADMRKLTQGWWPQVVVNEKGQRVRRIERLSKEDAAKVGLLVVEGTTSLGTAFKLHIAKYGAAMGSDRPWVYEEEGETFGGISKYHYGAIQMEMYNLIVQTRALNHTSDANAVRFPNLRLVVWTALEGHGETQQRVSKYGPQIAGTAVTTECPQWLGDCIHLYKFSSVEKEEGTNIQSARNVPVAFFLEHPDPETEIPYLAKARVAPSAVPYLLKQFPGGYIKLEYDKGLEQYMNFLERLKRHTTKVMLKWKEGVDKKRGETETEKVATPEVAEEVPEATAAEPETLEMSAPEQEENLLKLEGD